MELYKPSIETLVQEIAAVNQAWKEACDLVGNTSGLAVSLRHLKNSLQVRLLRLYAPKQVYLVLDTSIESEEALYGLKLVKKMCDRAYADHLPVRVAQAILSPQEIEKYKQA